MVSVREFVPSDNPAVHSLFRGFVQQPSGHALGPLHPAVYKFDVLVVEQIQGFLLTFD